MDRKTKNQLDIGITASGDCGKCSGLDLIRRQDAIDAFYTQSDDDGWWVGTAQDAEELLKGLPSAEPEYEPVTAEDFAKTMSENTTYSFMSWHGEALELMKEQGFVICKKTM